MIRRPHIVGIEKGQRVAGLVEPINRRVSGGPGASVGLTMHHQIDPWRHDQSGEILARRKRRGIIDDHDLDRALCGRHDRLRDDRVDGQTQKPRLALEERYDDADTRRIHFRPVSTESIVRKKDKEHGHRLTNTLPNAWFKLFKTEKAANYPDFQSFEFRFMHGVSMGFPSRNLRVDHVL